ncbi:MAG: DNA adenine methylase [Rhodospirillales bacterium]
MTGYSPLRYPGGKGRFSNDIAAVIASQGYRDVDYLEPYAGGAEIALHLLFTERVTRVFINDYDPAIFAFWRSVVNQPERFCEAIESCELSTREWQKQKATYVRKQPADEFDLGFAAFYLNRTNRSGIIATAGPIGGHNQSGKWKIDARFNRESLSKKVERIARFKDRIIVTSMDGVDFLAENAKADAGDQFVYADPPYYGQGNRLYRSWLDDDGHKKIAAFFSALEDTTWLLSYDECPEIARLYKGVPRKRIRLPYSANKTSLGRELLFHSPGIDLSVFG